MPGRTMTKVKVPDKGVSREFKVLAEDQLCSHQAYLDDRSGLPQRKWGSLGRSQGL